MVWLAFSGTGVHVVEADDHQRAHDRAMQHVADELRKRGYHPPTPEEVRVRRTSEEELASLGLTA